MDACRKYGIKRYHQVSTDEVFGDLPLIGWTCSLRKRRRFTLRARTARRSRLIYWFWPIIEPTDPGDHQPLLQ